MFQTTQAKRRDYGTENGIKLPFFRYDIEIPSKNMRTASSNTNAINARFSIIKGGTGYVGSDLDF